MDPMRLEACRLKDLYLDPPLAYQNFSPQVCFFLGGGGEHTLHTRLEDERPVSKTKEFGWYDDSSVKGSLAILIAIHIFGKCSETSSSHHGFEFFGGRHNISHSNVRIELIE